MSETVEKVRDKFDEFYENIIAILPKERVFKDYLHRLAYGTDASFYRLIPKVAVVVENGDEVKEVLSLCDRLGIALTFRAAGSSVSGQSMSDSVLVMISRDWREYEIKED
ncbi:MAG: FAD-binding oxidoreductase, partial [Epsilonproteobacteria bacterium]|nr:FAD-binding oxidoreductase [Campylobacterota bacterium]